MIPQPPDTTTPAAATLRRLVLDSMADNGDREQTAAALEAVAEEQGMAAAMAIVLDAAEAGAPMAAMRALQILPLFTEE